MIQAVRGARVDLIDAHYVALKRVRITLPQELNEPQAAQFAFANADSWTETVELPIRVI